MLNVAIESELSRLALGCYALGGGYGNVEIEDARATVDAALDAGWNLFDTAEAYLSSEERLGQILEGRRDKVFLASKVFPCEAYTARNIQRALNNSLKKLRTDHLDLYQLHGPQNWIIDFPDASSIDEIAQILNDILATGKVLNVGVCNIPIGIMQQLHNKVKLFSTQNLFSLFDQGHADDGIHLPVGEQIIPWARENSVRFLAFSPLARGLLADGLDPSRVFLPEDERYFLPRFQPRVFPEWARLANELEKWACDHQATLVQLAVAWTLSRPGVTSTLVGAKTARQVKSFVGAMNLALSSKDLSEINAIVGTLSVEAAQARSIVWDHFPPEAVNRMRDLRHSDVAIL